MAAGTLVLAIAAVFATKANRKFAAITTVALRADHSVLITNSSGFGVLTTVKRSGYVTAFAKFYTGTGTSKLATVLVSKTTFHTLFY